MWESRPLPKIVRDPLAALSARGSFFMLFPLLAHGGLRKISRPACDSDRPRYSRGFFVLGPLLAAGCQAAMEGMARGTGRNRFEVRVLGYNNIVMATFSP